MKDYGSSNRCPGKATGGEGNKVTVSGPREARRRRLSLDQQQGCGDGGSTIEGVDWWLQDSRRGPRAGPSRAVLLRHGGRVAISTLAIFGAWKGLLRVHTRTALALVCARISTMWVCGALAALLAAAAAYCALDLWCGGLYCTQRRIANVPQFDGLPGGPRTLPIVGNMFQLGPSAPLTYWTWRAQTSFPASSCTSPTHNRALADPAHCNSAGSAAVHGPAAVGVFQARLGARRVVVANSYAAVKRLWMAGWASNCSRPVLHTFHAVLSRGQGTTIGTTPYSRDWRAMRAAAARALNSPAVASYAPIIERESSACVQNLARGLTNGQGEVDLQEYFETYALRVSLAVAYGFCLEDAALMAEIIEVEKEINRIRSAMHSLEDYLPMTRRGVLGRGIKWIIGEVKRYQVGAAAPEDTPMDAETVAGVRARRAAYMETLMSKLQTGLADAAREGRTYPACIIGNVVQDSALTAVQVRSTCLTMVSAGLDTIPVNIVSAAGHLAAPGYGARVQATARDEIEEMWRARGGPAAMWRAWGLAKDGLEQDDTSVDYRAALPYVTAVLWESMRHSSAQPINLARETVGEIEVCAADAAELGLSGRAVIPAGTMLVMNTLAANFDEARFDDPFKFDPERYLEYVEEEVGSDGALYKKRRLRKTDGRLPHLSFGAGARVCAGSRLAEREMYVALMKLVMCFDIVPCEDDGGMETNVWRRFGRVATLVVEPERFRVRLSVRAEARGVLYGE